MAAVMVTKWASHSAAKTEERQAEYWVQQWGCLQVERMGQNGAETLVSTEAAHLAAPTAG